MPKQNERKKTINKVSNTLQIKHEPNFFFLKKTSLFTHKTKHN
jgi:hypothetical protein